MSLRAFCVSTVVLLGLLFVSCGGDPPDKELQDARSAIAAAKTAGADRYAADEFKAAEDALKNAVTAVEQRDYRLALNHALDSRERAENATKLAADGKAAAREEADHAISAATMVQTSANAKLRAALTAHVPAKSLNSPRFGIAAADARLQEARTAFESNDFQGAIAASDAASQALKQAIDDLDAINGPPGRRRR